MASIKTILRNIYSSGSSGGVGIAWSDWDASTNAPPTNPQLGTFYQATDDSTTLLKSDGQPVDAGDILTPKVSSPGIDITDKTKWAVLKATWGTYSAVPEILTLEINP